MKKNRLDKYQYRYAILTSSLMECVEACYMKDYWLLSQLWNSISDYLMDKAVLFTDASKSEEYKAALVFASQNIANFSVCSKTIIEKIIPLLIENSGVSQESINIDSEWGMFFSKTGLPILHYLVDDEFCNDLIDPMWEARSMAQRIYSPELTSVVIIGGGFGYLAYQLWKCSEETLSIYVYEKSSNLAKVFSEHGVYTLIDEECLNIYTIEDEYELVDAFKHTPVDTNTSRFLISDWALHGFSKDIYNQLLVYLENQKSIDRFSKKYAINYENNKLRCQGDIGDIIKEKKNDIRFENIIVVAAGPSLNENIDYIKENQAEKAVIAIDASLKKLLKNEITPDFVTILDPNLTVMDYLQGVEEKTINIPLIADSVACAKYINHYQGPVYRVFANDYQKTVNECEQNDIAVMEIAGTVSSLAIEEAIWFGAKKIELIGLDLGYPGNKKYADGIGVEAGENIIGEMQVRSTNGGIVGTTRNFNEFRIGIQQQIRKHPDIQFINLSKNGAWIEGTMSGKWWEKLGGNVNLSEYLENLVTEKALTEDEKYYLFRQIKELGYVNENNISEYDQAFKLTFSDNIQPEQTKSGGELIILLASEYNISDCEILEDAVTLMNNGKTVIIINTNERTVGKRIAIEKYVDIISDSFSGDKIVYQGIRIPYFEFPKAMGIVDIARATKDFICNNRVDRIIAYDKYSLVADRCVSDVIVKYKDSCR